MKSLLQFVFIFLITTALPAQSFTELSPMPERVTNNAVTAAQVDGEWYVYSFAGIDSTKGCDGDHLRSWRYQVSTDTWTQLPDIPDALGGKIAAGASTIKGKIYVLGGYHLAPNCNEVSSAKIHIFDPVLNDWLPDGADIPVAIDDQVQVVWKDSLLYSVTGWSNNTNVTDVQIYNPSTDEWQEGTPIPSNTNWRVFGASGVVIGDTLYYSGGASLSGAFNASNGFRKGYIDPNDPISIEWSDVVDPLAIGYRMASTEYNGTAIWLGGSLTTYNFDGIAYNGSGGVPPLDRIVSYNPAFGQLEEFGGFIPEIMDLRGIAQIGPSTFIIAGGMEAGQVVTNKTWRIDLEDLPVSTDEVVTQNSLFCYPNPASDRLFVQKSGNFRLIDPLGRIVLQVPMDKADILQLPKLQAGIYIAHLIQPSGTHLSQKISITPR